MLTCQRDRNGDQTVADAGQLRAFRARVTMVFQQFNLSSYMTARDNVMLGPIRVHGLTRAEAGERAVHYLARAGVGHGKDAYPVFLSGANSSVSPLPARWTPNWWARCCTSCAAWPRKAAP